MSDRVSGQIVRAVAANKGVRILGFSAAEAAEELRRCHNLGPKGAELGAQAIVAAGLLSGQIKGDERITLQIQGTDPRLGLFAEVDASGNVRARLSPTEPQTSGADGITGVMVVIKSSSKGEMYRGATEVRAESLQDALSRHMGTSSQIDHVLRIDVLSDGGVIQRAAGWLAEKLPGASDWTALDEARSIATLEVLRDADMAEVFGALGAGHLMDEPLDVLDTRTVQWQCTCSRERVRDMLMGLGGEAVRQFLEEDQGAEVSCHFCNEVHQFDEADLAEVLGMMAEPAGEA